MDFFALTLIFTDTALKHYLITEFSDALLNFAPWFKSCNSSHFQDKETRTLCMVLGPPSTAPRAELGDHAQHSPGPWQAFHSPALWCSQQPLRPEGHRLLALVMGRKSSSRGWSYSNPGHAFSCISWSLEWPQTPRTCPSPIPSPLRPPWAVSSCDKAEGRCPRRGCCTQMTRPLSLQTLKIRLYQLQRRRHRKREQWWQLEHGVTYQKDMGS